MFSNISKQHRLVNHEMEYFKTLYNEGEALVDSVLKGKHMDPLVSKTHRGIILMKVLTKMTVKIKRSIGTQ